MGQWTDSEGTSGGGGWGQRPLLPTGVCCNAALEPTPRHSPHTLGAGPGAEEEQDREAAPGPRHTMRTQRCWGHGSPLPTLREGRTRSVPHRWYVTCPLCRRSKQRPGGTKTQGSRPTDPGVAMLLPGFLSGRWRPPRRRSRPTAHLCHSLRTSQDLGGLSVLRV